MKNLNSKTMLTYLFILISPFVFMQCEKETNNPNTNEDDICSCIENDFEKESLSTAEIDALLLMREEEKLARDVYLNLLEKWDSHVFENISASEQRHMDYIACLLEKYELDDPIEGNDYGVFENQTLTELYSQLIETGQESLEGAYTAGATIEDLDIFDLMNLAETSDNNDIKAVFDELTRGSRNHMRAFIKNLGKLDTDYTPQYISQTLFDEIIDSDKETGGALCGKCANTQECNKAKNKKGKMGNGKGLAECPNGNMNDKTLSLREGDKCQKQINNQNCPNSNGNGTKTCKKLQKGLK
jgi:hypothetical protein